MNGDFGGDHGDMARAYYGPQVEDSDEYGDRARRLIGLALGTDWPALELNHLVITNEVDFDDADRAYRKVYGYGIDAGVINDRQDKREVERLRHPFRSWLIGVCS